MTGSGTLLFLLLAAASVVPEVAGHGRLIEPPSRGSMWRFGFKSPENYDDNQLFCGGSWVCERLLVVTMYKRSFVRSFVLLFVRSFFCLIDK